MKAFVITIVVISFIQSASSQIANPFSGEGCGDIRSCFRNPVDCDGTDGDTACDMFVSWWPEKDAEVTNFALFGKAEGYIAVGISLNAGMPNTDVYACTSRLTVKRSYNPPDRRVTPNEPKELIGVSNISVTVTNGYVECEFKRQQKLPDGDDTFFDISGDNRYYSLMAIGNNLENDGDIDFHDGGRQGSDEAVSFSRVGDVDVETTTFKLFKAHGAMMAVAWIGFAAPGITVARYMKPSWENKLVCGVKVWFVIHRFNMSMTFILTCAAFVIIFVAKKTFLSLNLSGTTRFVHALFGTTIMGLALINVIMAIFRPHPGTPKRKYYNWAHRSVGLLALGLSAVTMLLGLNVNDPFLQRLPSSAFWVLVAFIPVQIIVWLLHEILPRTITVYKDSLSHPIVAPKESEIAMSQDNKLITEREINEDPPYKQIIHNLYSLIAIFVSTWVCVMICITDM